MEKIKELIEALTPAQSIQLVDNIGCHDYTINNILVVIGSMLVSETLIFDGARSLFYKRTGLMVWDKFR